jgi:tRNA uridine 5-carbamoylmethylation protein Kti12
MSRHLIIVNGYPKSGKDAFVDYCCSALEDTPYWTRNVSSVDNVKKAALLLGWDGAKDESGRNFLSELKDLSTHTYDGPMQYMRSVIESVPETHNFALFFHIREPEEIAKFVTLYPNTITVCVHRIESEKTYMNTGDRNVLAYPYDKHIENYTTLRDLKEKANKFVEELICE